MIPDEGHVHPDDPRYGYDDGNPEDPTIQMEVEIARLNKEINNYRTALERIVSGMNGVLDCEDIARNALKKGTK